MTTETRLSDCLMKRKGMSKQKSPHGWSKCVISTVWKSALLLLNLTNSVEANSSFCLQRLFSISCVLAEQTAFFVLFCFITIIWGIFTFITKVRCQYIFCAMSSRTLVELCQV